MCHKVYQIVCDILDKENILGSGEFGLVLKGTYRGQVVAVETLKPESTKEDLKSLLSEVKVLVYTGQHENIVQLVGAVTKYLRMGKNTFLMPLKEMIL